MQDVGRFSRNTIDFAVVKARFGYNFYKKFGEIVKRYNYFIFTLAIAVFHTCSLDAMRTVGQVARRACVASTRAQAVAAARARVHAAHPVASAVRASAAGAPTHAARGYDRYGHNRYNTEQSGIGPAIAVGCLVSALALIYAQILHDETPERVLDIEMAKIFDETKKCDAHLLLISKIALDQLEDGQIVPTRSQEKKEKFFACVNSYYIRSKLPLIEGFNGYDKLFAQLKKIERLFEVMECEISREVIIETEEYKSFVEQQKQVMIAMQVIKDNPEYYKQYSLESERNRAIATGVNAGANIVNAVANVSRATAPSSDSRRR